MTKYERNEYIELGIVFTCFIAMAVAWYFMWVKPNDEIRWKIVSCMEENTEEQYIRCRSQIASSMER